MSTSHYLFGQSSIGYSCWGTGPILLFCFHGYGESADSFASLATALSAAYTVVAIDMPYHGSTDWKEDLFFAPGDLPSILEGISAGLPGRAAEWTILGYSMGGRVALHLFQLIPEKISKLILLAPDGLQMNPWYWFATQTRIGNRLFRYTMAHAGWLFFILRIGHAFRMVNPGIYKFATRYIDNHFVRHNLYIRWTIMRGFRPDLDLVRKEIRARHIPVRLLYGRFDRIIRWQRGARFQKGVADQCTLGLLSTGHQLLHPSNFAAILTAITS